MSQKPPLKLTFINPFIIYEAGILVAKLFKAQKRPPQRPYQYRKIASPKAG